MKRHTAEEVIAKLRQAEADLAQGFSVAQVCQRLGVSEQTLHRWRNQYGGLKQDDARRLKDLEAENARLKRLVADLALDKQMLQEVAQKKFGSSAEFVGEFPREKRLRRGAGSPVARPATSLCPVLAGAPQGGDASCPALR